jgi:anthranilate/para-aminobenzoate synthase component I
MIVDLMRNDLGRVAVPGSVRVSDSRRLERHHGGGITHGVATVTADGADDVGRAQVLRAAFPPGSVSGTPKVRALQIIDELEPEPRGWYCGTFALLDGESMRSSVNIRTLVLDRADGNRWNATLWVGAGIVADSDPLAEWEETLVKADPILNSLGSVRWRDSIIEG